MQIKFLPFSLSRCIKPPCIFIMMFAGNVTAQNTQLIINPGATFLVSGGNLVLNNTDITANGTLDASQGNIIFTGGSNTAIAGATTPVIKIFTLNKSGNNVVTLNRDISVTGMVDFQNGLIDLDNQTLSLGNTGILNNESETSRITGISGGWVVASASDVTNPSGLNIANLGAAITSTGALGNVNIQRTHKPAQNPGGGYTGIQRTFFIQPENNTSLNATLRFYYFDAELNGEDENTLSLWQSNDGVAWSNAGVTTRNTTGNYVEKTGLVSLSYFTLSDESDPLPVTLVYFSASCKDSYTLIEWKTATEINTTYFDVQKSTDGINWVTIQSVPAENNGNGSSYSYRDNQPQPEAYYRLKIVDLSGAFSYSPVFNGGCAGIAMPFVVYPNPAANSATARLSVRKASKAVLLIYNTEGQLVKQYDWNLQVGVNTLNLSGLSSLAHGTYLVKAIFNGTSAATKITKQ